MSRFLSNKACRLIINQKHRTSIWKIFVVKAKKRSGAAIAIALLVFLIVMVFGTGVITLFDNNLKQAKHQEYMTEAYYLAYSGIDLAFSALTLDENEQLEYLRTNGRLPTETENPTTIDIGRGTVTVEVDRVDDGSTFDGWIIIMATGSVTDHDTTVTRVLYVDPVDPKNIVWKDDEP